MKYTIITVAIAVLFLQGCTSQQLQEFSDGANAFNAGYNGGNAQQTYYQQNWQPPAVTNYSQYSTNRVKALCYNHGNGYMTCR